jgi:hypothetical protein
MSGRAGKYAKSSYKTFESIRKALDIEPEEFEKGLKARAKTEVGKSPKLTEINQRDTQWGRLAKTVVKKLTRVFAAPSGIESGL